MDKNGAPLEQHRIGLIGLGHMGWPMALNLQAAGADLVVYNRSAGPTEHAKKRNIVTADSIAALTDRSDVIIVMVSNTPAVEEIILGPNGVANSLCDGALVIDMGTTKVPDTRRFADAVMVKGAEYLDAPVSGGTIGAQNATLSIMAGGTDQTFARAKPILNALGRNIVHVGSVGAGQVAKAANQMIVGLTIGAVAEALSLAKRAGADPAKVREAFTGGFADSRILEVHGQRMINGNFEPGAKSTIQRKDLDQALELAASLGLELPATALNRDLYDRLIEAGHGGLDHAALIKAIDSNA